jgi:hypothetical protein
MLQAAIGDCHTLDPVALGADLIGASEVDVGRRQSALREAGGQDTAEGSFIA